MIDWFYSDPVRIGFASGVTREYQNFLEDTKTIVDASNHPRVVSNIVCDDFVHFGKPMGAEHVPTRLAAPLMSSRSRFGKIKFSDIAKILEVNFATKILP